MQNFLSFKISTHWTKTKLSVIRMNCVDEENAEEFKLETV